MTNQPSRAALPVLLAITFLSAVGMSVVFPVLPFVVQGLVPNTMSVALWVGVLESVYAGCALFAAPVLGSLSDRLGRRPILIVSLIGSALGWLLFGIGGSLAVLLIARIVDGVTAGDMSVAFAYMADISEPKDRAKRFGLAGAVSGVGFLVGPAIGGLLASVNVAAPVFLAAGASALTAVIALVALPESLAAENRTAAEPFKLASLNPFGSMASQLRRPTLRPLLIGFALLSVTLTVLASNFPVFALDVVGWEPIQIGLLLTGVGLVDIIVQGGLLGLMIKTAGERGVVLGGMIGVAVSSAAIVAVAVVVPNPIVLVVAGLTFATAEGATTATLQGLLSNAVPGDEQGALAGGVSAIGSAIQLVGPIGAGLLFAQVGPAAPYVVSVIAALLAVVLVRSRLGLRPSAAVPGSLATA